MRFVALQDKLAEILPANRPGSGRPHAILILPSFSVGETLLAHYGDRIRALEHRYLNVIPMLQLLESCHLIYVCTQAPRREVVDAYFDMLAPDRRADARSRFTLITLADPSHRSVAAKLLDDETVLDRIRELIADRPAFIEPWNVTESEVDVALRLGIPINGCAPELRPLGYKSAGRRLIRGAGVPVPYGFEDVHGVDDLIEKITAIRAARPDAPGVVVKHDDSVAGDGNIVIRFDGGPDNWKARVAAMPDWYLADLAKGGVVEELVAGAQFTSPSVQVDVLPGGQVRVLATHEQLLGGESAQTYMGCRFPSDPPYAPTLAEYGAAVGRALAAEGVLGRFSLDFAAVHNPGEPWRIFGLEVNLRKGGTTHPYVALRNLVPGIYDTAAGLWQAREGGNRWYVSTDNLLDEAWTGLDEGLLLDTFRAHGLLFDPGTATGVVPHMLACLAIDGRYGLTAIGASPAEAQALFDWARDATVMAAKHHAHT